MSTDLEQHRKWIERLPSDPYDPTQEEVEWMKKVTGIQDEEELKNHALKTQAQGLAVFPYPCLKRFVFTSYKIGKHPAYKDVLALGNDRPGATYLEIGYCFGNDVRKAISDGYPVENVIASDLEE
ncbi:hypothetical protein M422DRAFT_188570, partial [Sphaerobolus stellatus SS14]